MGTAKAKGKGAASAAGGAAAAAGSGKGGAPYRKFLAGCRNPTTRAHYGRCLERFVEFLADSPGVTPRGCRVRHAGDYGRLLDLDADQVTDCLEAWVEHLLTDRRLATSSVISMLAGPELFFVMNRRLWHKQIVRKGVGRDDAEPNGRVPVTTEEIRRMLGTTKKLRTKAFVHFVASTGIRPGAIADPVLRVGHLVDMPNPAMPTHEPKWCYAVRIYDGSSQGYWAFLTPEARRALDDYLASRRLNGEALDGESPLFASGPEARGVAHLKRAAGHTIIYDLIRAAGVARKKRGHRYDKAVMYMFRRRFNTILKLNNGVNSNVAEKLMAHKRGLDGTYLQPTRDECYREFVKAIPQLTVDPNERLLLENAEQRQQMDEMAARERELEEMVRQIDGLAREVEFLKNTMPMAPQQA